MAERICSRCGQLNVAYANFCSACGAQEFTEMPTEQPQGMSQNREAVDDAAALISVSRIVVLSALTSGLYFLYWLYVTWKQLQIETKEVHYPVWHALSQLVPIYGLFRLHKHVSVIRALALGVGVDASITPGLAVILVVLNGVLGLGSTGVEGPALLLLNLISFALTATVLALAQSTLNAYWSKTRGAPLHNMPMRVGERILIALGLVIWVAALF